MLLNKTVYDNLVTKVNNIDIGGFVLKTKYDTDKSDLEKKLSDTEKKNPDTGGVVKKTGYNSKITEIESKISSISGLVTNSALTTVENKTPNVSNLVNKTDYNTKLVKLKIKSVIMIMTNTLLLQNLIS